MSVQSIKISFHGVSVLTSCIIGLTLMCFADDKDGSQYFCSPSHSKPSCSQCFACCGLGCAFVADQGVSLMGDLGHAASNFMLFSRLFTCAVI